MRAVFLLPMVATPVAIALVWMMMYNPTLGVMNYLVGLLGLGRYKWVSNAAIVVPALAVVDTWEWTPLITLITLATLPTEPYESAQIDGASTAQMFWRITLPLLRPTSPTRRSTGAGSRRRPPSSRCPSSSWRCWFRSTSSEA